MSSTSHAPSCHLVFLAEFDINQGSLIRHSYPTSVGLDSHLLAEHMLPDGAHDRTDDMTVFYLNQVKGLTVDPQLYPSSDELLPPLDGDDDEEDEERMFPPPLATDAKGNQKVMYVLNVVRTQHDSTVRRGALVKALAIATYNPYIQIYRPHLIFALDLYFSSPNLGLLVLRRLYKLLNSIDHSTLPTLSHDEKRILRTTERKDVFDEKFVGFFGASAGNGSGNGLGGLAGGLGHEKKDSEDFKSVKSVKSTSAGEDGIGSNIGGGVGGGPPKEDLPPVPNHPAPSHSHTQSLVSNSTTTSSSDQHTRSRANTLDHSLYSHSYSLSHSDSRAPTPSPVALTPGGSIGRPKDTHWWETKVASLTNAGPGPVRMMPLMVPLGTFDEEVGEYSLIKLITTFSTPTSLLPSPLHPHLHTSGPQTPPIILLINAILTSKRVVFLGHGLAAGIVAESVLAACAIASGCGSVLPGVTGRAFPYTNLNNLDGLETIPGFIAGVCNPAFADRPSWWDVLFNLETGKVTVSKEIAPAAPGVGGVGVSGAGGIGTGVGEKVDSKEEGDLGFMDEILSAIQSHYGESTIRARFVDYIYRFVRLASKYEEDLQGSGNSTIGYQVRSYGKSGLGSGVVFSDEAGGSREVLANAGRIEAWRKTDGYALFQKAFQDRLSADPLQGLDLGHQLSRLRQVSRKMPPGEVELILRTLSGLARTDEGVIAILAYLPPYLGGLLPLAFGLFHPSELARNATLDLFDALSIHPTGRKFLSSLNAFHKSAYLRLGQERAQQNAAMESSMGFGTGRNGLAQGVAR
ncbi:spindle pole body interacting protein [Meredithblackwellia eburnea MCA 4105]